MSVHGLVPDFEENEYLWSGKITAELYDEDCVFTDPTLSFTGLATFERNLANLDPWIERFVPPGRRSCELKKIELEIEKKVLGWLKDRAEKREMQYDANLRYQEYSPIFVARSASDGSRPLAMRNS